MNLPEAFARVAAVLNLDPAQLMAYADEDTIGGFDPDETKRLWQTGSIWGIEGQFLYALIRAVRPARVCEIGIGWSCATTHILTALERNGAGECVSLDPAPANAAGVPLALRHRWTAYPWDAVRWLEANPDERFDFVMEDGPHGYEFTERVLSILKTRGPRVVLSHDAAHALAGPQVTQGFTAALGSCDVISIAPADCGFGFWANPEPPSVVWTLPTMSAEQVRVIRGEWASAIVPNGPRILYTPIIEPGAKHDLALHTKHGLHDALAKRGQVVQLDYLNIPPGQIFERLTAELDALRPSLLFTQIQGHEPITADHLRQIRERYPGLRIVNWNGDYWPDHLTSPAMLDVLRHVDLQLVINADVLPVYADNGIRAAYWQFGYETPVDALPDVPAYDVLYLGNAYSDKRKELIQTLRSLPYKVGIYGDSPDADGDCTYDFAMGEALYKNARLTISDSQWPDADGYTSNRIFQAMAAGCFVLNQRFKGCEERLGYANSVHYVGFDTFDELPALAEKWLKKGNDPRRRRIAKAGQTLTLAQHSFDERVRVLFEELLPEVSRA